MQAVGAYMRLLREARGMDRPVLAKAVGVAPNTLGEWELGKNKPNIVVFDHWCEILKAPSEQVMALIRNKAATPIEGARWAAKYLVEEEGLDEDTIRRLGYWKSFYGDVRIREALGPELD